MGRAGARAYQDVRLLTALHAEGGLLAGGLCCHAMAAARPFLLPAADTHACRRRQCHHIVARGGSNRAAQDFCREGANSRTRPERCELFPAVLKTCQRGHAQCCLRSVLVSMLIGWRRAGETLKATGMKPSSAQAGARPRDAHEPVCTQDNGLLIPVRAGPGGGRKGGERLGTQP